MPKGEGTRAWQKSGRQRAGAKIADPQDLEGMVKAVLPESQFPVGTIMTHRQSASRRCCPCQRLLKTAIRTSEGKTGDNASSQRNERESRLQGQRGEKEAQRRREAGFPTERTQRYA